MIWQILIAHAEAEEHLAEELANPLREAGYLVAHRGTVLIGESVLAEAAKVLSTGGPVILCATVAAMGTGWAHRIVNAANKYGNVRVFAVQMEQEAFLDPLALDTKIARYYEDKEKAVKDLIRALREHYPLSTGEQVNAGTREAQRAAREEFLIQKERVEQRIKEPHDR